MALQKFNQDSMSYEPAQYSNDMQPGVVRRNPGQNYQPTGSPIGQQQGQAGPYNPQPGALGDTSNMNGDPTTSYGGDAPDWTLGYKDLLTGLQAQGTGGGGGGAKINPLTMRPFDSQYTDFRDTMYGNIASLMQNPQGYSPEEYAMMQGRMADDINAGAAGQQQAARMQASRGGYAGTGIGEAMISDIGRQNQAQLGNSYRDLALNDMNLKREGTYQAANAAQNWAGQMGGEQQYLTGQQLDLDKDYQNRKEAADRARAGAGRAKQAQIYNLQKQIVDVGIQQQQYDDQFNFALMDRLNQQGQQQAEYDKQSYDSNPNYTGPR
jgi:hypothetical protein